MCLWAYCEPLVNNRIWQCKGSECRKQLSASLRDAIADLTTDVLSLGFKALRNINIYRFMLFITNFFVAHAPYN